MGNPFEDLAERQISNPMKARMRAAEKRKRKALEERDILYRQWQKWHAEKRAELLTGLHGAKVQELADLLERMTLEDADELIYMVERQRWIEHDEDTKFGVLELISHAIIYLRENEGLPPFDDALPGEDLTAFQIIREIIRGY